jgi:hypothetical protein
MRVLSKYILIFLIIINLAIVIYVTAKKNEVDEINGEMIDVLIDNGVLILNNVVEMEKYTKKIKCSETAPAA